MHHLCKCTVKVLELYIKLKTSTKLVQTHTKMTHYISEYQFFLSSLKEALKRNKEKYKRIAKEKKKTSRLTGIQVYSKQQAKPDRYRKMKNNNEIIKN